MKIVFPIFYAFFLFSHTAIAQVDFGGGEAKKDTTKQKKNEEEQFWDWSKVRVGGGLGLNFGSITFVNLSPTIGYQLTKRYQPGVGVTYIYYQDNRFNPSFVQNIYGGRMYNKFNLYKEFLFGYAEYEALNSDWNFFSDRRFYVHNIWAGGGLNYALGGNGVFYIMALWNINDSEFSPFPNPAIRIGFGIGL